MCREKGELLEAQCRSLCDTCFRTNDQLCATAMCSGEGEGNPAGGVELPASSLSRDGVWGHPWPVPGPQGALSHWWTPTRDELLVLGGLCGPRLLLREDCVADVPLQGPFQGALASV